MRGVKWNIDDPSFSEVNLSVGQKIWYKNKYNKEIVLSRHHEPGPFPLVLILDHLKAGYNVGKILRSANAFGCREVHLVGIPMFDPNPAKGALKHTRTRSFATFAQSYDALRSEGYAIYGLAPHGELRLGQVNLPDKVAFVMGHEEYGLSFTPEEYPEIRWLKIQQFGIVQSLNVSIAASMACYEYIRQRDFQTEIS